MKITTTGATTTSHAYNDHGIRVLQKVGSTETFYLVDENNHTGIAQVREQSTGFAGGYDSDPNGFDALQDFLSYTLGNDVISQYYRSLAYLGDKRQREQASKVGLDLYLELIYEE